MSHANYGRACMLSSHGPLPSFISHNLLRKLVRQSEREHLALSEVVRRRY